MAETRAFTIQDARNLLQLLYRDVAEQAQRAQTDEQKQEVWGLRRLIVDLAAAEERVVASTPMPDGWWGDWWGGGPK